ncbi:MAG: hypothetical protein JWQ83_2077 [Lacunisphaera sp.]|nr:hypothetical protein [Lacunisphaera sp.]
MTVVRLPGHGQSMTPLPGCGDARARRVKQPQRLQAAILFCLQVRYPAKATKKSLHLTSAKGLPGNRQAFFLP